VFIDAEPDTWDEDPDVSCGSDCPYVRMLDAAVTSGVPDVVTGWTNQCNDNGLCR